MTTPTVTLTAADAQDLALILEAFVELFNTDLRLPIWVQASRTLQPIIDRGFDDGSIEFESVHEEIDTSEYVSDVALALLSTISAQLAAHGT